MILNGHKVYISGKITGLDGYMDIFAKGANAVAALGARVVNPAKVNAALPDDTGYEDYMKMSLIMLDMCDTIAMLPNWKDSPGAGTERLYAKALGKKILYFDEEWNIYDERFRS